MKPTVSTLALFVVAAAAPAFGEQYRIELQGVTTAVSSASGSWGDDVMVGTPVFMSLVLDSARSLAWDPTATLYFGTTGTFTVGSLQMQFVPNFYVLDENPLYGDGFLVRVETPATSNRFTYSGIEADLTAFDSLLLTGQSLSIPVIDPKRFTDIGIWAWGTMDDPSATPPVSQLSASITGYSVTAIPEPATAGLWIGGAALIGFAVLRRKKHSAPAV
ncbi:MAG TPA: PEP-CTERM sorting domain-containing protein [Opitutaceae bacterium]|nr:PEP-CTERM sorting domain-containing protein [Opitutaceae bacterium]